MANTRMDLLALCVSRAGSRQGRKVGQFVIEWEMVVRSVGGPITTEQFAAWWKEAESTSYRRLTFFRAAFPELGPRGLPQDLMQPLLEELRNRPAPAAAVMA